MARFVNGNCGLQVSCFSLSMCILCGLKLKWVYLGPFTSKKKKKIKSLSPRLDRTAQFIIEKVRRKWKWRCGCVWVRQGRFSKNVLALWLQCSTSAQLGCHLWEGGKGGLTFFWFIPTSAFFPTSPQWSDEHCYEPRENSQLLAFVHGMYSDQLVLIYCIGSIWQRVHFQEGLQRLVTNWWPLIDLALR